MAKFQIKSANGQTVRYEGKPKYNGVFGKPSCLEFAEIASPVQINFEVGDYIDYSRTGFRYYLYSIPQPTKQSSNNTSGEGYVYKNVQFFCRTQDLEIAPFRDLVLNTSGSHFTTLPTVATYEDVYGIADRIQACLNDFFGAGVWNIVMYEVDSDVVAKMHELQPFSLTDGSVLDALNQIYKQWMGIGWIYSCVNSVHTITIGRPNVQNSGNTTDVFYYGKGHGLKVIAKAVSSKNEIATRIFAYGSDRNLPTRWYNNKGIYESGSVYIPNLMIPTRFWGKTNNLPDARKAYIEDASKIEELGLRVKTVRFDGTGDYEEIYPSIEGMTFGELRDAEPEYTPSSIYDDDERVDELKAVTNPTDSGIVNTSGTRYKEQNELTLTVPSKSVAIAVGQKSYSRTDTLEELCTLTNTGILELNLSGVEYKVQNLGPYISTVSAYIKVLVGETQVFRRTLKVAVGTDLVCALGKYNINIDEAGDLSIIFGVEAELHDVLSTVTTAATAVVPTGVTPMANIFNYVPTGFSVVLKQIGFDISKQYTTDSDGYGTIEMKSGACAGRSFVIRKCTYRESTDDWLLDLQREEDSSLGQVFPNSQYTLAQGDRFVITGIMMPDIYVEASMEKLYNRAVEALGFLSKPKMVYAPEIDSKVIAESGEYICEGMYMRVYDTDIIEGQTEFVLINSLTIDEASGAIPLYSVTLRDEKVTSVIEKITGEEGKNSIRIGNLENADDRKPYDGSTDESEGGLPGTVRIICDSPFFTYGADKETPLEDKIVLTCEVENIDAEYFLWQYWNEDTDSWSSISGATAQAYNVLPDGVYFPEGDLVARLRCVVNNNTELSAEITIVKLTGSNGYTVMLSTPALTFAAGEQYAYADTAEVGVYAFKGKEQISTDVGTITGGITGKISAIVVDDKTTETKIQVSITTACDVKRGMFTIPVTVDGMEFTLNLSWSLSCKGGKGDPGGRGDQGLIGPAVRGPQDWNKLFEVGTETYRFSSGEDNPSYPNDHFFIDLMLCDSNYYLCKKSYNATASSPKPSVDTEHWKMADAQYAFVATQVLLAINAKIRYASSNQLLLLDANDKIVGGGQGRSNAQDIIWWAGAQGISGDPISAAPWRVAYDGQAWMTAAHILNGCDIGQFTVASSTDAGVTRTGLRNGNGLAFIDMHADNGTRIFRVGTVASRIMELRHDAGTVISILTQNAGSVGISITKQAGAQGIVINNEEVVTSPSILHIWKGTQAQYDAITTKDNSTLYIIV